MLDAVGGDVLVLFFSAGHYRQPLAFSRGPARGCPPRRPSGSARRAGGWSPGPSPEALASYRDTFFAALRNDFNTAEALASLYGWIREANRSEEAVGDAHLVEMLDVLGLIGLLARRGGCAAGGASTLADAARAGAARQGLGRGRPAARRAARHGLGGP